MAEEQKQEGFTDEEKEGMAAFSENVARLLKDDTFKQIFGTYTNSLRAQMANLKPNETKEFVELSSAIVAFEDFRIRVENIVEEGRQFRRELSGEPSEQPLHVV